MSEKQFLALVIELAKRFGYKVEHVFEAYQYARRTSKGFPDLVLVKEGRLIFAELKGVKGQVSPEQYDWLEALGRTGAEVYLWREDTDTLEEIAGILRG